MFIHQSLLGRIISQLLILVGLVLLTLPLMMIITTSLSGEGIANYGIILSTTPFAQFFLNSVIITFATVALVIALSVATAFAIATLRPRGSAVALVVILAGMSLPAIALIVPLFYVVQALGLLNTYWAVIVPLTAISIPFGVLVATNYIRALPIELWEAARLDGAGHWTYFSRILVPICLPIIAVIAIFTFLAAWNEYLLPLVFIQDTGKQVLTQVPTYFQSQRLVDTPKVFAANVLISVPIVLAYIALQKSFRRGMSAGAVK
jgi:raffinose/stachyose/melibiose transport system permease protein